MTPWALAIAGSTRQLSTADTPSADASSAPALDQAVSSSDVLLTPPPAPPVRSYAHCVSQAYAPRAESSLGSKSGLSALQLIRLVALSGQSI